MLFKGLLGLGGGRILTSMMLLFIHSASPWLADGERTCDVCVVFEFRVEGFGEEELESGLNLFGSGVCSHSGGHHIKSTTPWV